MNKKKGAVSWVIQVIFTLALIILTLTLVPKIILFATGMHSEIKAYMLGQFIASGVNALSTADKGLMEKELDAEWDIEIYKKVGAMLGESYWVNVSHGNVSKQLPILGWVKEATLPGVNNISIIKEPGEPVVVS